MADGDGCKIAVPYSRVKDLEDEVKRLRKIESAAVIVVRAYRLERNQMNTNMVMGAVDALARLIEG